MTIEYDPESPNAERALADRIHEFLLNQQGQRTANVLVAADPSEVRIVVGEGVGMDDHERVCEPCGKIVLETEAETLPDGTVLCPACHRESVRRVEA